jgi:hypothetical protein
MLSGQCDSVERIPYPPSDTVLAAKSFRFSVVRLSHFLCRDLRFGCDVSECAELQSVVNFADLTGGAFCII